jgi:hypothetical protein
MARTQAEQREQGTPAIGLLNEKPLHAALKRWYAEDGDRFEVPIDGFVADIVRGRMLIEIQTGASPRLKRKLEVFLRRYAVRLVLPVASRKTIVHEDEDGRETGRRASPRRAKALDAFRYLVTLGELLGDSNLSVDIVLVHEEEVRRPSPRRKGFFIEERRLVEVQDCVSFHHPAEYLAILPPDLGKHFTTADLARALRQPRWMAQKIAYVLRTAGMLCVVGKFGNALVYRRAAVL